MGHANIKPRLVQPRLATADCSTAVNRLMPPCTSTFKVNAITNCAVFVADYIIKHSKSERLNCRRRSCSVSLSTHKTTQCISPPLVNSLSLSIIWKISTTPSENLNACIEHRGAFTLNRTLTKMSVSGMSRRTRVLPQHDSNSAVTDRRPDKEWAKKRAHSRFYLWLHRRRAFLNPQWRLLVFLMSGIIGSLCVLNILLRISNYHSSKNVRLIGEFPRCVYFADDQLQSAFGGESLLLEPNMEDYPSDRFISEPMSKPEAQDHLLNSKDYKKGQMTPFESESCHAQDKWQMTSYPTCNTVYEFDLTSIFDSMTGEARARLLANGFWRDVWSVREEASNDKRVLKTMRYKHPFSKIHSTVGHTFVYI
jgi:hypothetical protein